MVYLVSHTAITDPLSIYTPVPSNSHLDLSLNMNLNPETTRHDDMYNVKFRQPDILYESVLFKAFHGVCYAMFKVISFVDNMSYLKSFNFIDVCINWLEKQLTELMTNPSHMFMERNLSKVIKQTPP